MGLKAVAAARLANKAANAAAEAAALQAELAAMKANMKKKKPVVVEAVETPSPKRGRPKGSKNKPKIVEVVVEQVVAAPHGKKKPALVEPEAPVAKPKKTKNTGPWSLREDGSVAHNGRVLQAKSAAHYALADGGAIWIVGRTVDNRAVFHATGIDGAGNALTPATFAGSPEIVCVILNAYCATLALATVA